MPYLPPDWAPGDRPLSVDKLLPIAQFTLSVCDLTGDISHISARPFKGTPRGSIYRAQYKGNLVVLKTLRLHSRQTTETRLTHRRALLESWFHLKHPNILELLGLCEFRRTHYALVLPWVENGTITMYLDQHPTAERSPLVLDVLNGLRYLHSQQPSIIHGHVKAGNVYIRPTGEACLSDFTRSSYREDADGDDWQASAQDLMLSGEMWRWTPPEELDPERYSMTATSVLQPPLDVYSFGMLVYEIYTGRKPFYDKRPVIFVYEVADGKRPPKVGWYEEPLSTTMWEIAQDCWKAEWQRRPTIDHLIAKLAGIVRPRSHFAAVGEERQEKEPSLSSGSGSDEELPEPAPAPRMPALKDGK